MKGVKGVKGVRSQCLECECVHDLIVHPLKYSSISLCATLNIVYVGSHLVPHAWEEQL